jgi:hypothetical protein
MYDSQSFFSGSIGGSAWSFAIALLTLKLAINEANIGCYGSPCISATVVWVKCIAL